MEQAHIPAGGGARTPVHAAAQRVDPRRPVDAGRAQGAAAASAVLGLQRTAGNAAVQRLLWPGPGPGQGQEQGQGQAQRPAQRPALQPAVVQRCGDHAAEDPAAEPAAAVDGLERHLAQRLALAHAVAQRRDEPAAVPEPPAAHAPAGEVELSEPGPAGEGESGSAGPTFDHSGGQTVSIAADTAVQFAQGITAAIGAPHVSPVFTPDIATSWKTDAKGDKVPGSEKITAIGLTVATAITKVKHGGGRPDAENARAIKEMVTIIAAHEGQHRAIIESAATAALSAAQKTYVGTGKVAQAHQALTKTLECTTGKGHEALDAKEGLLTATEARDDQDRVTVSVVKSGSGAKYPCPK